MNRVVHFEIHVDDVEASKKFYQDVFGWEMQQMGEDLSNYVVIKTGPMPTETTITPQNFGINGGMLKRNAPKPQEGLSPMAFVCIVAVDSIETYIEKCRAAGAKEHMPKTPIPGVGVMAYFADPSGNIFGMLQPDMPAQA